MEEAGAGRKQHVHGRGGLVLRARLLAGRRSVLRTEAVSMEKSQARLKMETSRKNHDISNGAKQDDRLLVEAQCSK